MGGVFVEFFSDEALENVMTMLQYKPDRVIYLGHKHTMITKKIESLRDFTEMVSPKTLLEFREVARDSLNDCISVLQEVADEYPDANFELTGGGEMILIAFGYVSAKEQDKGIKLNTLRIDPYTATEVKLESGAMNRRHDDIKITVEQNIVLHGGHLTDQTGSFSTWDFNDDFKRDIRTIWAVACRMKHKWNNYCSVIEDVFKDNPPDEEGRVTLPKSQLGSAEDMFEKLNEAGMLRNYRVEKNRIEFYFKNNQIKNIVTKTGNLLELHVYEVASRRPDIFTDKIIGAVIDWNPKKKDETEEDREYRHYLRANYDTINEIDVVLMRSTIPTFISCKSGKAGSLALHELETVTSRFGGNYAKKVLVMATPCDKSQSGMSFFKQRAKDMHIWVLDNVYEMSDEKLLNNLIRIQGV